jgi:hypothetical protein
VSKGGGEVRDGVSLTNLDQPLFEGAGAAKCDLVDYLDAVADLIILGLRDRPLSVVRVRPRQAQARPTARAACASVRAMKNTDTTEHWAARLRDLAIDEDVPGAVLGIWADGEGRTGPRPSGPGADGAGARPWRGPRRAAL